MLQLSLKLALLCASCQLPCSHQDPRAAKLLPGENHLWFIEVDRKQLVIFKGMLIILNELC